MYLVVDDDGGIYAKGQDQTCNQCNSQEDDVDSHVILLAERKERSVYDQDVNDDTVQGDIWHQGDQYREKVLWCIRHRRANVIQ
ncbi:MAG: hypothetical protein ABIH67_02280 [Candidatus Uhrbacteria bacterium]